MANQTVQFDFVLNHCQLRLGWWTCSISLSTYQMYTCFVSFKSPWYIPLGQCCNSPQYIDLCYI